MKTLKILLLLLALVPFNNLFSQYFIDHDKVEQVWQQNLKGYWAKPEEVKDKNIYLQSIHRARYISDIKIGFDKIEYKSDDLITVTLKRGYENKTESEKIRISADCDRIFSDHVEIQKNEIGSYNLYLKKGQEVKINLSCNGRKGVSLYFSLGRLHPESREYHILYSDKLQEGEFGYSGESPESLENILVPQEIQKFMEMEIEDTSELVNSPGMTDSKNSFSYSKKNYEIIENDYTISKPSNFVI